MCSCEFPEETVPTDRHFEHVAQTKGEANALDPVLASVREILTTEPTIRIEADEPKRRR